MDLVLNEVKFSNSILIRLQISKVSKVAVA
jgi:hypothetical protein